MLVLQGKLHQCYKMLTQRQKLWLYSCAGRTEKDVLALSGKNFVAMYKAKTGKDELFEIPDDRFIYFCKKFIKRRKKNSWTQLK